VTSRFVIAAVEGAQVRFTRCGNATEAAEWLLSSSLAAILLVLEGRMSLIVVSVGLMKLTV